MQRVLIRGLLSAALIVSLSLPVGAAENSVTTGTVSIQGIERIEARATVSFDLTVKSGFTSIANQAFPMEAGETVTIKAAYTPMDASVDVGLVDSDGAFHYFNVKMGVLTRLLE